MAALGHMDPSLYDQGETTGLEGEYHELHSIMVDGGDHFGVSALAFDTQELLWMGNQGGHVTSYYGLHLEKHASFQAHPHGDDIRQLICHEMGILSLSKNQLRLTERRGVRVFEYSAEEMHEMQCMLQMSPTSVMMGGHQTKVIEVDLQKGQEIRQVDVEEPGCAIFRMSTKFLCGGDTSGKVTLFDPNTMIAEHVLEAHSGTLSDFDLHGNLLVTAGFSNRMGSLNVDRFLMVYDLRTMRAMAPTQVIIDPMFLRFVPTFSNRLAVVSQTGQFQLVEATAMTAASMMLYQIHTHGGLINTFDISSSCQTMAFGDSTGYLHLFGNTDQPVFNSFPEPTEFVHPPDPHQPIHINDELTPLSIIPMQYPTQGTLLSDWPHYLCQKVYRKPKPVDSEILRSMKIYHNVGYAPNPGNKRRNQVQYKLNENNKHRSRKSSVPESPMGRGDDPFIVVPKRYRRVEIKYSRLGVEDFDFRHYNKTNFAGLETHIPNAYCNSMLQVLYFIEPLRVSLLNHMCAKEFCLACELGYLFHMLDKQKGQTCQASNFLRVFRTIPEAAALGLVLGDAEESMGKFNLSRLIQSWQRFLHQQIHSETCPKVPPDLPPVPSDPDRIPPEEKPPEGEEEQGESTPETETDTEEAPVPENKKAEGSVIKELFSIPTLTMLRCRCGHEVQRETESTLLTLSYPDCSPPGPGMDPQQISFSQVLQHSMVSEQSTQAWCNICDKYQPHIQSKAVKSLPDVLALNCEIENQRDLEFWKIQQRFIKSPEEEKSDTGPRESTPLSKMCRYGAHCARQDCRFRHPAGEGEGDGESFLDLSRFSDEDCFEPSWVPLGLKISQTDEGQINIEEIADDESMDPLQAETSNYYEIFASVSHVKDSKTGGNLVACIKVGERYHQRKENVTCTQWYLFNDFSITPIEKLEGCHFNLEWKVPSVIYFIRRDINRYYNLQVQNPITSDVLFNDTSLVNAKRRRVTMTPLSPDEVPKENDIIGLDAEFVSLNQEESELRSDGTRSTIKPSHLAVARISCIRGSGELAGEPFIDDYIATQEQVVDYLTQFSGIKPGDLDPNVSTKYLTNLKSTYNKLRYLVDQGVIFVGHGLKKDFRVINIVVPKDHILDTVELFQLPRQRMISLKFLAWYFLKLKIQSFTHDSVEDARTALQLYEKYQEMSQEGMDTVRARIKEMYEFGRKVQWKIPEVEEEADSQLAEL
ncbi:LOW QUALITY PROTEIN: PAN2-PAN3 deadenylation complex catalytic subunit PAN2-like [Liolophura sinensis]|uniref:LOW QUALITY PROTEIN: PAN2-PAN3 deadenylation complex catalytic subunit PAN2-like n=1 Tax=Liolophura sinensis TaxID=3198878 RepID=UPI0031586CDE